MELRKSIADGILYPRQPDKLRNTIREFESSPADTGESDPLGLLLPHGEYSHIGELLSRAVRCCINRTPKRILILCPLHTPLNSNSEQKPVYYPYTGYETPLGTVNTVDTWISELETSSGVANCSAIPYEEEHSFETALPFIQYYLPGAAVLPVFIPRTGKKQGKVMGKNLAKLLHFDWKTDLLIAESNASDLVAPEKALSGGDFFCNNLSDIDKLFNPENKKLVTACGSLCILIINSIIKNCRASISGRSVSSWKNREIQYAAACFYGEQV